ncbi:hypothetical protein ZIOFF_014217 [Zingiber officinale]|uniref:Uncharacterized protein n=1 Tax=Zingiber officinale TaxID=94328 RepID=A0A8J5LVA7_ZINOF|nr:hypothetical protein ZIOFF_014217 [Zingiber officinale]
MPYAVPLLISVVGAGRRSIDKGFWPTFSLCLWSQAERRILHRKAIPHQGIGMANVRRLICCGYVSSVEEGKKEIIKECAILWWDN